MKRFEDRTMQTKNTVAGGLALVGQLFHELSILHVALLAWLAAVVMWFITIGASLFVGTLPTWALAACVGFFAIILFATWRIGQGWIGVRVVGGAVAAMIVLGASGHVQNVAHDAIGNTQAAGPFSFTTVIAICSWSLFAALLMAALVASVAYVDWARQRRARK
jgi:hypothetical protein